MVKPGFNQCSLDGALVELFKILVEMTTEAGRVSDIVLQSMSGFGDRDLPTGIVAFGP